MARWALIAGEHGEQTADAARRVVAALAGAGLRSAGFVQHKQEDEDGRRYEVVHLRDGERLVLARDGKAPRPGEETFCSMAFDLSAFDAARRWLAEDAADADCLVLDGIGKLEAGGSGHAQTLAAALRLPGRVVLIGARASQLARVVERFQLPEADLVAALDLPAADDAVDDFHRALAGACRANRAQP